jgi:hypothetical protein
MESEKVSNATISTKLQMIGLSKTSVIEIVHASPLQGIFLLSCKTVYQFPLKLVMFSKV